MNDQFPKSMNPEDEKIAQKLSQAAEQTHARAQFGAELEERLRNARPAKTSGFGTILRQISPALGWVVLMILIAFVLNWSIKTLIPAPQPAGVSTPNGFVCPVTQPNGSLPPGTQPSETTTDPNLFGNGELWTVLWPAGKVYMLSSNQRTDGSFETNWPWYRGVDGQLTIEGRRIDAQAEPLRTELPEGFNNFQGSTLIFPTTGCWEITGHVGGASLTFVTEVVFDAAAPTPTLITTPNIVANATATPIVEGAGYDWRGTKLYLATSLPESPSEASVYAIQPEQPATIDSVRALADQFGMNGEIFESELEPNAPTAFSVVDGDQRLNVRSDRYFEYIPDYTKLGSASEFSIRNPNAEAIIDEFMRSHNFNFPYTVKPSELYQGFYAQAITPDGLPIHHEFFTQNGLLFRFNDAEIISVSGSFLRYDEVGTYGIKTAQEAFEQVLASTDFNGLIEGMHSSPKPPQVWKRDYPLNQTVILYGWLYAIPSVDGKDLLVSIDSFPAKGNLAGTENLGKITLVKATGRFTFENETKVFNVESWEVYKRDDHGYSGKDAFPGTLQKQGEEVIFVYEGGTLLMPDVPADVPLPLDNAYVYGVVLGDIFEWEGIEHRENNEQGGGGGSNGMGFYKLNLSGSPMPFPTPTALPPINPGPGNYIVKEGDTCGSIGAQFGVSIRSIIAQNQLAENCFISVGQALIIPGTATPSADVSYVVQENDTLASIALNFGISVEELKQANNIVGNTVYLGQKLFIPGQQTDNPYVGMRFEKQRGTLEINIYNQADGSSREEFVFIIKNEAGFLYTLLENVSFEALIDYHHRPLEIWGTVNSVDKNGTPIISVEKYEAPYPGLKFQLLQGTQKSVEINGAPVNIFTTDDGKSYVQMTRDGLLDMSIAGDIGEKVYAEALLIPDETFEGYPVMRIFNLGLATNPETGEPLTITITADQPNVIDETLAPENYVPPEATIESVELVYYISNPRFIAPDPEAGQQYIQPAWRFHGHYSSGDEFEILIQALKQEYLLPELAPYTRPG